MNKVTFSRYLLFSIFSLLLVHSQTVYAQCTGCTTIIPVNSSADITLNSSTDKICITGGTFTGTITLNNGADMCIGTGVDFSPTSITLNSSGSTIDNFGSWNTAGFALNSTLNNFGDMTISGSLTINSSAALNSAGTSLTITGNLVVNDEFTLTGDASIGGNLTVNGSANVIINDGVLDVAGNFTNNGTVSAAGSSDCGQISVAGNSRNNGSANYGTDGSALDICDASATDDGFDVNFGPVPATVTNCVCEGVLPVELISFSAQIIDNQQQLRWVTVQEKNSSHFEIERSEDGKTFYSIGQQTAQGYSTKLISYEFIDTESINAVTYYRLKMMDLDGSFEYSKVVEVSKNPVVLAPKLWLDANTSSIHLFHTSTVNVALYKTDGTLLRTMSLSPEKNHSVESLTTGLYILHYQVGNQQGTWRFVKE